MNEIIIDYDELEKISNELTDIYEDYKKTLENISKEITNVQEEKIWLGQASNIFTDSNEKYIYQLKRVEDLLKYYGNFLKNTNNIYKELENDYSGGNIDE